MRLYTMRKKGSVMVLTVALIPFFLILIAFAIYVGMLGIAKSQLDGAADAASHAGAAGGAYAYHGIDGNHVVVEKEPDPGHKVLGGLNSAQAVWDANQNIFIQGVSAPNAQFNPPGMENGWDSAHEYYAGHFWVTDNAHFQSVYLPGIIGQNSATLQAVSKSEVHLKR